MRKTKGCPFRDQRQNVDIRTELNVTASRIRERQIQWRQHFERMEDMKLPKQVIRYRPQGRQDIGRTKKQAVSYTHLDVYKRQCLVIPLIVGVQIWL